MNIIKLCHTHQRPPLSRKRSKNQTNNTIANSLNRTSIDYIMPSILFPLPQKTQNPCLLIAVVSFQPDAAAAGSRASKTLLSPKRAAQSKSKYEADCTWAVWKSVRILHFFSRSRSRSHFRFLNPDKNMMELCSALITKPWPLGAY